MSSADKLYQILLLEDNDSDAELIKLKLNKLPISFELEVVSKKESYLQNSLENPPDIILSEYNLKGFTGMEALLWARKRYPELPFILVTGYIGEELAVEFMRKGASDYVLKDNLNRLAQAVKRELFAYKEKKQKQKLLDKAYEMAEIGHWELDVQNSRLYWSPTVKKLHGVGPDYEPDLEKALNFYKKGNDRETITHAVKEAIKSGEPFDVELQITTAEGDDRWIRAVGEAEFVGDKCVRVFGSTQNIDQRKQAEVRLREIIEHSTNMFYKHDTNHVLSYVSPQSKSFLGCKPEEAIRRWTEFATDHPINKKGFEHTQRAIDTGKVQPPFELQLRRTDGQIIWVRVNEAPVIEDGKTVAIIGSLTDITERKKYEEELEQLSLVASKTTDIIVMTDADDRITWVNEAFTKLNGYTLEESLGQNPGELLQGPETDPQTVKRLGDAVRGRRSIQEVILNYSKAGKKYWLDLTIDPIFNDSGVCTGFIAIEKDVTKQMEREHKLEESLKEKDILLMEVHHRVKNNLAVVSGMMQLQAFKSQNDGLQKKLFDSVSRIQTMATIHELLYQSESFTKIVLDQNIHKLVSNIMESFQSGNKIETVIKVEPIIMNVNQAIPCSLIINEVVTNVIKHAFEDGKAGKLMIEASESSEKISIRIEDNGIGLPDDIDTKNDADTLGFKLIDTLTKQLNAEYIYKSNNPGTLFSLTFDKNDSKAGIGSAHLE